MKKYAVHTPTQADWDYVTKELGYLWITSRWIGNETCIGLTNCYADVKFDVIKSGCDVISMDEFDNFIDLRKIYFDLYDQLEEPHRSKAKANWDYLSRLNDIPKKLEDAILGGFIWDESQEGIIYWADMHGNIGSYIREQIKKEDKPWKPKRGEMVEAKDVLGQWLKGEFIAHEPRSTFPYLVLVDDYACGYENVRPINHKNTVTRKQVADWIGCKVEDLKIID